MKDGRWYWMVIPPGWQLLYLTLITVIGAGASALKIGGSESNIQLEMDVEGNWYSMESLPKSTIKPFLYELRRRSGLSGHVKKGTLRIQFRDVMADIRVEDVSRGGAVRYQILLSYSH